MASYSYSPSRPARMAKLNTIIEDDAEYRRSRAVQSRATNTSSIVSPVPSLTSTISSYYHSVRYSSDPNDWQWNDLYDASDDEHAVLPAKQEQQHYQTQQKHDSRPRLQIHVRPASGADSENRDSWITDISEISAAPTRCPSIVVPSPRHWPTIDKMRASQEAGTLSPAAQMPISPLALSMLPAADLPPAPSRTPSLDSLTSGETASSAPTSPTVDSDAGCSKTAAAWGQVQLAGSDCSASVYDDEDRVLNEARFSTTGVQLPQDAMSFLQNLSIEIPNVEVAADVATPRAATLRIETRASEMVEVPMKLSTKPSHEALPQSAASEYSLSQLSIPSPGGFLSSLNTAAARTWALDKSAEKSADPDSTTAENFYNAPWRATAPANEQIREQVIEVAPRLPQSQPVTAVKLVSTPATAKPILPVAAADYDERYQTDLRRAAEMSMDRTSSWLRSQCDYVQERLQGEVKTEEKAEPAQHKLETAIPSSGCGLHRRTSSAPQPKKKAVKFLDTAKANEEFHNKKRAGPLSSGSEPLFYQAFQHMSNLSSPTDSFTNRSARYEALQARRSSVSKHHATSVIGAFQAAPEAKCPSPQRPISILPGHEPEVTFEQRVFAQAERERDAIDQVAPSMWVVEALRYLSGGRLLNSPAAGVLRDAPDVQGRIARSDVRVLDLGGQPSCDWAWHCAREFPNVKTYTATADARVADSSAQLRGPSNHRVVSVDQLWRLPFPDNHFDAISARSLFAHLKAGQRVADLPGNPDQLDATLAECMRVLRPGGYLEFFVLDAEVVRGGPRGTAASVEFGYKLRQRGYDPNPTKPWLGRVRRAGFCDIKRAWMFLPMGALREQNTAGGIKDMPPTPPPDASIFTKSIEGAEAVQGPVGSAADVAEVSGLVGSWLWEQWILKLEMEMGKKSSAGGSLGANVGGVVEEGRKTGSGWRCLSGWAQKPE